MRLNVRLPSICFLVLKHSFMIPATDLPDSTKILLILAHPESLAQYNPTI